ncbi:MAG TPA: nucleotidyltransferase family protein [Methylomirabilota bacterium]|jgi:MurNAc alpha-1-phosphate uridylyltransferase|nr:nucleotidyltransferase family protein [Methylomirabilota bacterium]
MSLMPTHAMVLAAGKGLRLRPITLSRPKPLVEVAGRAMLDGVLDRLDEAGVPEAVVNAHHLGDMIEAHLQGRTHPRIHISREQMLLETGGGVKKALPFLGEDPFFVINGDVVWRDGKVSALQRLGEAWDPATMDALLLVHSTASAVGYDGPGDFVMDQLGRLRRRKEGEVVPFLFAGLQILSPSLFADTPEGPFSLNLIYDRALAAGRLYGLRHDGTWYHVGTPEDLERVEAALAPGGEPVF